MTQINNVDIIREINDRYMVVKYFDAEVIYDKETKFINATKLCQHISKLTGKQKLFKNWIRLKQTQDFINDIKENINNKKVAAQKRAATLEGENIIFYEIINAEYNIREIKGTYLHLDLIPQLCNWASKEYAFKISYIINYINGIKDYDSAYSKVKNDKLKEKDEEIKSKTKEIKKLEEDYNIQLKAKDEKIEQLNKELKETKKRSHEKTSIIKEKDQIVKNLKEQIKAKTEELEKLRETKSEDDIEIQKLKRDIQLLKSHLELALKDNETLNDKIDKQNNIIAEQNKKIDLLIQETKENKEQILKCTEQNNQLLNNISVTMNELLKTKKEKDKAETESKEIKKELKEVPEIILILVSKENDKNLYISRIKQESESKVISKFKKLNYKFFKKYQTYNSVINYKNLIKEYKESGMIKTNRNYIILENLTIEEFDEIIKEIV